MNYEAPILEEVEIPRDCHVYFQDPVDLKIQNDNNQSDMKVVLHDDEDPTDSTSSDIPVSTPDEEPPIESNSPIEAISKLRMDPRNVMIAKYGDNYYGTPKKPVEEMLKKGLDVFLEIEVQGGLQMMDKRPDALSIFIVPPSLEELESRLRGRNTETEEVIKKRLSAVEFEKQFVPKYDVKVVNDKVEDAVNQVIDIVKKEKEKRNN